MSIGNLGSYGGGGCYDLVIGCVGKPSSGKSTFFNAVTSALQVTTLLSSPTARATAGGGSLCGKLNCGAKVGNYPFTTISPNEGIGQYSTPCPCTRDFSESHPDLRSVTCKPRYGNCIDGVRQIPVKLLDVAGLIPGASEGLGLGNKFLDDLRHAHVLLHIIDVSGTTNEKGETTVGYDPTGDHDWLVEEIQKWIFNNLWQKWGNVVRKFTAAGSLNDSPGKRSLLVHALQQQLSGYGVSEHMISGFVDVLAGSSPLTGDESQTQTTKHHYHHHYHHSKSFKARLLKRLTGESSGSDSWMNVSLWEEDDVQFLANEFVKLRFPFVLVLNKVDRTGTTTTEETMEDQGRLERHHSVVEDDRSHRHVSTRPLLRSEDSDLNVTDRNALKLASKNENVVLCSALVECFLNKMCAQGYIRYTPGSMCFSCLEDEKEEESQKEAAGKLSQLETQRWKLKSLPDDKVRDRLQKIRDLVLFRNGSTGVQKAIERAVQLAHRFPVYPVRNIIHLGGRRSRRMFQDSSNGGGNGEAQYTTKTTPPPGRSTADTDAAHNRCRHPQQSCEDAQGEAEAEQRRSDDKQTDDHKHGRSDDKRSEGNADAAADGNVLLLPDNTQVKSGSSTTYDVDNAFPECILVRSGKTVRELARTLHCEIDKHYMYAEGIDSRRLAETELLVPYKNDIIRYVTSQ